MNDELQWKIAHLPESPGCYKMKSRGEIIYIGKAKNLKNRVKQYFQASKNHSIKVRAMVARIDDLELVLVDSELEALVLEANLIRLHKPFYNILLKDDKRYPFIAIYPDKYFPPPELRRKREKDHAKYFGPYTGTTVLYQVMDIIRTEFKLRSCTKTLTPGKKLRPCVHYQVGRCMAPCAGLVDEATYRQALDEAISFLNGDASAISAKLKKNMTEASLALDFERAALCRDRLQAIEQVIEKQKADIKLTSEQDILVVLYEGEDALVQLMNVREGKLIGSEQFVLERAADETESEILLSFIMQYYSSEHLPPRELLLSNLPEESAVLAQMLSELSPGRAQVRISVPQRGEKHHLLDMAKKNLQETVTKRRKKLTNSFMRTEGALIELADILNLPNPPHRIEGYDISNTQGTLSYASMVVMLDGVSANKAYRSFRIKTVQGPNDFASMHEAITRRLSHGLKEIEERKAQGLPPEGGSFSQLPDLILIDGGRGQLNEAQRAMHAVGLDIPMFGLAKRIEEIVLPDREDSIVLARTSPALHLLQRLRDEAHRFAITKHRNMRAKHSISSQLDTIPGIGPTRKRAILTHFKTSENLYKATIDEISAVEGMNKPAAENLYSFLHTVNNDEQEQD